jgi:hypothetical protein
MKHCLFLGTLNNNNVLDLDMWKEALQQITPEMWKNSVRHTRHTEQKSKECWHREQHLEDQVEALIFVANTSESLNEFDLEDNNFFI